MQQPDGTLAHIPRWMMEETAARYSLGSQPRLPLDHLRNLRFEIDALLNFLHRIRTRRKPSMKRKSVKQHLDLFEQDKEPVRVPPGLRKEMLHLVEMLLIEITAAMAIKSKETGDDQDHA